MMSSAIVSLTLLMTLARASAERPNIVMVLLDDVGWADFNYTSEGRGAIPTPNIDKLSSSDSGLRLSQHYVHTTCTPSRAALMTGR